MDQTSASGLNQTSTGPLDNIPCKSCVKTCIFSKNFKKSVYNVDKNFRRTFTAKYYPLDAGVLKKHIKLDERLQPEFIEYIDEYHNLSEDIKKQILEVHLGHKVLLGNQTEAVAPKQKEESLTRNQDKDMSITFSGYDTFLRLGRKNLIE